MPEKLYIRRATMSTMMTARRGPELKIIYKATEQPSAGFSDTVQHLLTTGSIAHPICHSMPAHSVCCQIAACFRG